MYFSLPIFLLVLGLGVVQLAVGVVVGRCLPVRRARPTFPDVAVPGGPTDSAPAAGSRIVPDYEHLQSRLHAIEERLQQQAAHIEAHVAEARTDPLTRLPNRRALEDELVRRVAEWQRRNTVFCLMLIDVDHFRALNEQQGHLAGDRVLRRMADVLLGVLRETYMVARLGGDELAVVLPDTSAGDARRLAESLRKVVAAEQYWFEDSRLSLTISLGLAIIQPGDDPISLVSRANEALYAAKRAGRDCAFFHNGLSCHRIQPADLPETALQEISDHLRQRVEEVVSKKDEG
jgi:diguanylate cyclase